MDDLLSDHQYNFLWSGTALLYPICRKRKRERERDHIAHFRKFQYDDENHRTIQPHRGLCGMVSHFQISESHGLWFQGTCVCLLLLFLFVVVSASVLFVTISSYYLERRIRKVMVVLTPWLVKMVVVIAAIIILIRVC